MDIKIETIYPDVYYDLEKMLKEREEVILKYLEDQFLRGGDKELRAIQRAISEDPARNYLLKQMTKIAASSIPTHIIRTV